MASETESLLLPFILGLTATNPLQENQNQAGPRDPRDRVIIINPITQTMFVMESDSLGLGLDSIIGGLFSRKSGQKPASKSSIEAMRSVEIVKSDDLDDEQQCVVCLEDWENGDRAKEMPCKHRFHGECIEKWLKINGCCPVCRYEMPVEEEDDDGKKNGGESGGGERRREILVSFSRFGVLRNLVNNQNSSDDESGEGGDHSSNHQENGL